MVLDNSLVVLENIFSKIENGYSDIKKAAIDGATEVSGAILASTLTTVAVFVPIFFLSNEIGQLFKDIAISISISGNLKSYCFNNIGTRIGSKNVKG